MIINNFVSNTEISCVAFFHFSNYYTYLIRKSASLKKVMEDVIGGCLAHKSEISSYGFIALPLVEIKNTEAIIYNIYIL